MPVVQPHDDIHAKMIFDCPFCVTQRTPYRIDREFSMPYSSTIVLRPVQHHKFQLNRLVHKTNSANDHGYRDRRELSARRHTKETTTTTN